MGRPKGSVYKVQRLIFVYVVSNADVSAHIVLLELHNHFDKYLKDGDVNS